MPLNKDLSDLPSTQENSGWPPDKDPTLVGKLVEGWWSEAQHHDRAQAADTPFRASSVGYCGRSMYYQAKREPESNPATRADVWRMGLGSLIHEAMAPTIRASFPEAAFEVPFVHPTGLVSGHADIVLDDAVVDIKTINGFGYKMQATTFKGAPSGPKRAHILQPAMAASALFRPKVIVLYLSMELVGPDLVKTLVNQKWGDLGRFAAQWTVNEETWQPMVTDELVRLRRLSDIIEQGDGLPLRMVPDDDGQMWEVTKPTDTAKSQAVRYEGGEVVDTTTTWMCGYCRYRDRCLEDGA